MEHSEQRSAHWTTDAEHFSALLQDISQQTHDGPDIYWQSAFAALHEELGKSPIIRDGIKAYAAYNPNDALAVSQRKIYSSLQQFVIPLPGNSSLNTSADVLRNPSFPEGFEDPSSWQPVLELLKNNHLAVIRWRLSLIDKDLQSNVVSRFVPPRVASQLYGLDSPIIYSGGASFGVVEKMEKLYRPGKYRLPVTVSVGRLATRSGWNWQHSDDLTSDYVRLLNSPYKVNRIVASDIDPPNNPDAASYAYSNSFRASEFANVRYRQFVNRIIMKSIPGLFHTSASWGDFTALDHVQQIRKHYPWWFENPDRKVQMITSNYINASRPDGRDRLKRAEENAMILAGDRGIVLWMDFCKRTRSGRLRYKDDQWEPGDYNLFGLDMSNQSAGKLHLMTFKDGRASEVALGDDLDRIAQDTGNRLTPGMLRQAA